MFSCGRFYKYLKFGIIMDNHNLVSLLQSKDDEAWEGFYKENSGRIADYFFRRGMPYHTTEELTQETVICAFQSIPSLQRIESLTHWLYGIAHHIFLHYLREKYKEPKPIEPLAPLSDPSNMKKLSPREIEIVRYRLIEDLQFKEISRILGTADSTVRVTFMRAKNKLRNHL